MPCTETSSLQANPRHNAERPFGLTSIRQKTKRFRMKTLLCVFAALLCMARLEAANIVLDGTLTWKVAKPNCTFKLDGAIQNLGPGPSGTLKLILWATPAQFPSRGYALATYNLGQLSAGYQLNDFSHKTTVSIPKIDGKYYFTIAILEYTTAGWLNRDYVTTGRKLLDQGEFMTGIKWLPPAEPILAPPSKLAVGGQLKLTVRADENLDEIIKGTWAKTTVTMEKQGGATVLIAGDKSDWIRTYTVGKSSINNQKVPTGKLYLDPEDATGSSTITLFFQSSTAGVYKNVMTNTQGGDTTWGTFSFK